MKRLGGLVLVFFFVLGISLSVVQKNVEARRDPVVPGIASGSWTGCDTVDVSQLMGSQPAWLQLLTTEGAKVTQPGTICHPFRGGQFGWIGEIRQFVDGNWIKVPTTNGWLVNAEGKYVSCAQASAPGIYALFGYYTNSSHKQNVDPGEEDGDVPGCTDPEADNYDPLATIDDDSCTYGGGDDVCNDENAINFGELKLVCINFPSMQ